MACVKFAKGGIYSNSGVHIVDLRVISCYLGSYVKTDTGYVNPPTNIVRRSPVFAYLDFGGYENITTLKFQLTHAGGPLSLVCVQQEDENAEELGESVCTDNFLVSAIDHKPGCFLLRGMLVPAGPEAHLLKTVSWAVLEKEQAEEEEEKAEEEKADAEELGELELPKKTKKLPPEGDYGIDTDDPNDPNWQVYYLTGNSHQKYFVVPYLKASDDVTVSISGLPLPHSFYSLMTSMIYFKELPGNGVSIMLQRPQTVAGQELGKLAKQIYDKAQIFKMELPEAPQPEKKHLQLFVKRQVSFEDE